MIRSELVQKLCGDFPDLTQREVEGVVTVDAKRVPYFKPGKEMRDRLNLQEVTAE
jgi:integration host factor subunit beta